MMHDTRLVVNIFEALGFAAIAGGGLLAAFSAKRPSRLAGWASAYLVLIAGLAQVGLAYGWSRLLPPDAMLPRLGMVLFDLGNVLVLAGTVKRYRAGHAGQAVRAGGACLLAAMLPLLGAQNYRDFSWTLVWYLAIIAIILIGMPIGLLLSHRRTRR